MNLAESMWHLGQAMERATPEQIEAFWPNLGVVVRVLCGTARESVKPPKSVVLYGPNGKPLSSPTGGPTP
jgi:hypothetical protein